jgi:chemotaxis protein histidine kinase CheA
MGVVVNIESGMLEMFRAEVETHMSVLNDGLLALEQDPRQEESFEALMRAAHSIKGAARIVGLPAAVAVAHSIEDCFVAARNRQVGMTSDLVDLLLEGVDLLGRAADVDDQGRVELEAGDSRVRDVTSRIARVMGGVSEMARGESNVRPPTDPAMRAAPLVLRAPARLDGAWAAAHRDAIASRVGHGRSSVRLDLRDAEGIDAAALAFLSLAVSPTKDAGQCGLRLEGARPEIERVLRAVGLGDDCCATRAEK